MLAVYAAVTHEALLMKDLGALEQPQKGDRNSLFIRGRGVGRLRVRVRGRGRGRVWVSVKVRV